ncbi:MAG: hypothetical protein QM775_32430 [Pirellulales bacterium]
MKMPAPDPDMVTIYHARRRRPRWRRTIAAWAISRECAPPERRDGKSIRFRFAGITIFAEPGAAHIRHLTVDFEDATHFTQEWSSIENGKEQSVAFHWTRKAK